MAAPVKPPTAAVPVKAVSMINANACGTFSACAISTISPAAT
jgi:hypothetical protein